MKWATIVRALLAGTLVSSIGVGSDREVAFELRQMGGHRETELADLYFETGSLSEDQMSVFAGLVEKGIADIAAFTGVQQPRERKIRYYISSQFPISHSRGNSVYLPLARVANQSAPYLHETAHVIVPCGNCPMWFNEGLASFVQSYVAEHLGGYDGFIFARRGNRGIDRDAARWLANDRGRAVLPFIGKAEEPPQIMEDRSNVAAPYYVRAQSLVKYMVENTAKEKLRLVMDDEDFDEALGRVTGKSAEQWKQSWLSQIGS